MRRRLIGVLVATGLSVAAPVLAVEQMAANAPGAAAGSEGIVVKVSGIRYKRGPTLDLMLYASEKDKDADNALLKQKVDLKPDATEHTFVLIGVPAGIYMIVGAQDANGNGELDTGLIGIPKEGYFSTKNKRMPSWENCRFDYDGKGLSLEVKMIYW